MSGVRMQMQGNNRGIHTLRVKDLRQLNENTMESNTFLVGNFKWKLTLTHERPDDCSTERLKFSLWSCNYQFVTAHVGIFVHSQNETLCKQKKNDVSIKRRLKTACPFDVIDQCDIPFERTPDSEKDSLFNEELAVTIDLKDTENANQEERQKCGNDELDISLEIINRRRIQDALNKHVAHGIVLPEQKRNASAHGHSSARLWSEHFPDRRYWLMERSKSGNVAINKCLNGFNPFFSFLKLCEGTDDSNPMITLFEEEKHSGQTFQPVDENTLVVFCKLSEPKFRDPSFIGYLLPQKTMRTQDLLYKLAMKANLGSRKYKAYLEQDNISIRDITGVQGTLNESGIYSGACIILRRLETDDRDAANRATDKTAGHLDINRSSALSLKGVTTVTDRSGEQASFGECIELQKDVEGSSDSNELSVHTSPLNVASADGQRSLHFSEKQSTIDIVISLVSKSPEGQNAVEYSGRCTLHASH